MKKYILILGLLPALVVAETQSFDDLLAAAKGEQEAFKKGDCDRVAAAIDVAATFYMNGRKSNREQVVTFCRNIKRPFGAGRSPIEDVLTPYKINDSLGYTVRDFRWENADNQIMHEVVTKIWRRTEGVWRVIHFQSTVVPE